MRLPALVSEIERFNWTSTRQFRVFFLLLIYPSSLVPHLVQGIITRSSMWVIARNVRSTFFVSPPPPTHNTHLTRWETTPPTLNLLSIIHRWLIAASWADYVNAFVRMSMSMWVWVWVWVYDMSTRSCSCSCMSWHVSAIRQHDFMSS